MKIALSPTLATLALLTLLGAARADSIPPSVVGSVAPLGDGLYKYQYTVSSGGPGSFLNLFAIPTQSYIPVVSYLR